MTASNLFKYCGPEHGLLLFKRHHPLQFTADEVAQLLSCAAQWFSSAAALHSQGGAATLSSAASGLVSDVVPAGSSGLFPMLLWNCMPRAGASQFHGHAQVALCQVPFPSDLQLSIAQHSYAASHNGASCFDDSRAAHDALGLAVSHGDAEDRCYLPMLLLAM